MKSCYTKQFVTFIYITLITEWQNKIDKIALHFVLLNQA
jgi:hypothetical protein